MEYNFNNYINRYNSNSKKWDKYKYLDIIPMWLADTDFCAPVCIIDALLERVKHGIFGYGSPPIVLIDLFIERMKIKYNWVVKPEWLVFLPGVISGLYLSVRIVTNPKDIVLIPEWIYPPFRTAAAHSGCFVQMFPISFDKIVKRWYLDIERCSRNMIRGNEKLLMLCNPHNPIGTAYRKEELMEYLNFAQKYNLFVCSDEIHCDFLLKSDIYHIPFGSLNDDAANRSITLMSPSKSFNIPGLGLAIAIIPNIFLREKFLKEMEGIISPINILSYIAAISAWSDGQDWLNQQVKYISDNMKYLVYRINTEIPAITIYESEATFLAWLNIKKLNLENPVAFFESAGVGLSAGKDFGNNDFVRLNFGCTKSLLHLAINRMILICKNKLCS